MGWCSAAGMLCALRHPVKSYMWNTSHTNLAKRATTLFCSMDLASTLPTRPRNWCFIVLDRLIAGKRGVFPQQRKLMGPAAQNSSGVHWCRRRVRFNEVPEKVPEKVLRNLGAKPSEVQQGSGEGSGEGSGDASGEGQEAFGAEPGQVQQGFGESSGEGLGGFGAEPRQAQQGSRESSGEGSGEDSGEGRGGRSRKLAE